jgi:hypothetical protein
MMRLPRDTFLLGDMAALVFYGERCNETFKFFNNLFVFTFFSNPTRRGSAHKQRANPTRA